MINNLKKFLPKYFSIIEGKETAKYLIAKNIKINYNKNFSIENLWKKHNNFINYQKSYKKDNNKTLLDLKIEISSRIFNNCIFCENKCKINRKNNIGKCNVKESRIASEFIHLGEEKILIPSYTIFFSGCTFKCIYCQNWTISQKKIGNYIKPENFAKFIDNKKKYGIKNVNWVGGDPTPNILYILKTLYYCKSNIPQIWNSNMYCSLETMKIINNIIDLYLTDFKYGNDKCAKNLSKINNYCKIIKRNHKIANKNGEIIIRHLILPNHIECCSKPILNWINDNLNNALINIMNQYQPYFNANLNNKINRCVNNGEIYELKKTFKRIKP